MTRAELWIQVQAKLSDRYNYEINYLTTEVRLFEGLSMIPLDLCQFRDQLEDELGIIPIDESMVKFWRTPEDILNSYKTT